MKWSKDIYKIYLKNTVEDINTFDSDKKKIELKKIISEFKKNMIRLKNKLNKKKNSLRLV